MAEFDPDAYLAAKTAPQPAQPSGFDPNQYLTTKYANLASDHTFDAPSAVAQGSVDPETGFQVQKLRDARPLGEKIGSAIGTAVSPSTWGNAAKGVGQFALGLGAAPLNILGQFWHGGVSTAARAVGADDLADSEAQKQLRDKSEAVLAGQNVEESLKGAGRSLMNLRPKTGAFDVSGSPDAPLPLEDPAEQAKADEEANELRARSEFQEKVQAAKNALQLGKGKPLESGAVAAITGATGTPVSQLTPDALASVGAPPVRQEMIEAEAAAANPENLALAAAPELPGAQYLGGKLVQGAGKALQIPGRIASAIPGRIGRTAAGGAGAGITAAETAIHNPAVAAGIAGGVGASKGLQWLGEGLEQQGGAAASGAPSALDTAAANARLNGQSAVGTNAQRVIGDAASRAASTAIGMTPANLALSEGDPETFAKQEVGAVAFGGAADLLRSSRPTLVEAARPALRQRGIDAQDLNTREGRASAQFVQSLPEAQRNTAYELQGALQGLPVKNAQGELVPSRMLIQSDANYQNTLRNLGIQNAPQGGGQGFFWGPDGTAYINGEHSQFSDPQNAAQMMGHEFAGHAAANMLQAAGAKGGPIYDGLVNSAKQALYKPDGTPKPEFQRFIDSYNRAFDPTGQHRQIDANDPNSVDEFLAETAGRVISQKGAADIAVPKSILDKVTDGIGTFMSGLTGVDPRKVGNGRFDQTEVAKLSEAVRDSLSQLAGFKREGGAITRPQTPDEYVQELQDTLAKPRPTDTAENVKAWVKEQAQARKDLADFQGQQPTPSTPAPAAPPNVQPVSAATTQPIPQGASVATESPEPAPAPVAPVANEPAASVAVGPQEVASPQSPEKVVADAEQAAIAKEKNGRANTGAAKKRVQDAKVEALAEAGKQSPDDLHVITDSLGAKTLSGNINPDNPYHTAILKELGITPDQIKGITDAQALNGTPAYIRYRSAKSDTEGTGGEGSAESIGSTGKRQEEIEANPAQDRKEWTIQHKVAIPLDTGITKDGGVKKRFLVLSDLLHNAQSIFEWMKAKGVENPFGETPGEQEQGLVSDAQAYARNHANGWKGDGSARMKGFPDSGFPQADPNYPPTVIPKDRFAVLNAMFNDEKAVKVGDKQQAVDEKLQRVNDAKTPGAKKTAQGVYERAVKALRDSEELQNLNRENGAFHDPATNETNELRAKMKADGFDPAAKFYPVIQNLAPQHILGVSDFPIPREPGDVDSIRPTGFDIDPSNLAREGLPNTKAMRAGFSPSEEEKSVHPAAKKLAGKYPDFYPDESSGKGEITKVPIDDLNFEGQDLDEVSKLGDNSNKPIILREKDDGYDILDGFGRASGMRNAGKSNINAILVTKGDITDLARGRAGGDDNKWNASVYDKYGFDPYLMDASFSPSEETGNPEDGVSPGDKLAREAENAGVVLKVDDYKKLMTMEPDTVARIRSRIQQNTGKAARFSPGDTNWNKRPMVEWGDQDDSQKIEGLSPYEQAVHWAATVDHPEELADFSESFGKDAETVKQHGEFVRDFDKNDSSTWKKNPDGSETDLAKRHAAIDSALDYRDYDDILDLAGSKDKNPEELEKPDREDWEEGQEGDDGFSKAMAEYKQEKASSKAAVASAIAKLKSERNDLRSRAKAEADSTEQELSGHVQKAKEEWQQIRSRYKGFSNDELTDLHDLSDEASGASPKFSPGEITPDKDSILAAAETLVPQENIAPDDFRIDFHIPTKAAHALTGWVNAPDTPKAKAAFRLWKSDMADFVASLPNRRARDAATGQMADPFAALKAQFPGGEKQDDISKPVESMADIAKRVTGASGQDYVNLLELLQHIGETSPEIESALERLTKSTYGDEGEFSPNASRAPTPQPKKQKSFVPLASILAQQRREKAAK